MLIKEHIINSTESIIQNIFIYQKRQSNNNNKYLKLCYKNKNKFLRLI